MNQIDEILKLATSQIGYKADANNYNKYNLEYYGHESGQPWCVVFQWWLFKHTGLSKLFYGGNKTASCGTLYDYYKSIGQTVPKNELRKGDLIFFEFNGVAHCHVGYCESCDSKYVTTIDGNTSETSSQSNGGEVLRRKRGRSCVWGVARPKYDNPEPTPTPTYEYYIVRKGDTLTKIAKKFNTTVDWLVKVNHISNPNLIYPGQKLRVK